MPPPVAELNPFTATAADVQELLQAQALSSANVVRVYLEQIDKNDGFLRAVTSIAPREWLFREARRLDDERAKGTTRGPLHGIPILIKDVVDTEPALKMSSTWGSLALAGTHPRENAKVINLLIKAGAIILGKTSMSEWGWFRGTNLPSGWCAVSGQGQTPYVLGGVKDGDTPSGHSNPSCSSSGSAIAVAAGFAPISIGAESAGLLVMPACRAALYTIKPTIGIVPSDGCLSISLHHDTLGPMAKSARDIADMLDVIVDRGATSVPDGGYAASLTGKWDNIRVGVLDPMDWIFGLPNVQPVEEINSQMMAGWEEAYKLLEKHASKFKRVSLITFNEATANDTKSILDLAKRDFKVLLKEYLRGIPDSPVHDPSDIIQFNRDHADKELPPNADNQDKFLEVESFEISDEEYRETLEFGRRISRDEGIDKPLRENDIDIIVGPSDSHMFLLAALAGYPIAAVPYGNVDFEGNNRPYGLFALTTAHRDALLVEFMSAWESVAPTRQPPIRTQFE